MQFKCFCRKVLLYDQLVISNWRRFLKKSLAIFIAVLSVTVAIPVNLIIVIGVSGDIEPKIFQQEVLKTSLQLFLIGVLSMLAREVHRSYSMQKAELQRAADEASVKRTQDHNARVSALNQLTQGYWGVKKCLYIIHGHKSALSYKKQMHLIIDHRLQLQKLNNEIVVGMYVLNMSDRIEKWLAILVDQLEKRVNEWTEMHLKLSWQQSEDEESAVANKKVPDMVENLPALKALWDDINLIHRPFEEAASLIRS